MLQEHVQKLNDSACLPVQRRGMSLLADACTHKKFMARREDTKDIQSIHSVYMHSTKLYYIL